VKKKALVLASCVAFATPSISIAKALPDNLVGLNLGDIITSSYLNQPFKGVIPFLFSSMEDTRKLSVRLAPQAVFDKIGAEKLPILDSLKFKITTKSNKPVILISSSKPIQLPFLNFVLEMQGPDGVFYQDYTVLLDPQDYKSAIQSVQQQPVLFEIPDSLTNNNLVSSKTNTSDKVQNKQIKNEVNNITLPVTYSSTSIVTNQANSHKIKSGDSLNRIARWYKPKDISLNKMMRAIFDKNPNAFIRGDINKIKRGIVLNLPTHKELTGLNNIAKKVEFKGITPKVADLSVTKDQYKVVKDDSLSIITKKFIDKNTSFTKLMNAIFTANPNAFAKNNINQLKAGVTLRIPSFEEVDSTKSDIASKEIETVKSTDITTVSISSEQTKSEDINSVTKAASKMKTDVSLPEVAQTIEETNIAKELPLNTVSISSSNQNKVDAETTKALEPNQYRVKKDDTLTKIAKEIGYKNVSFTKMVKALYSENIHAFEKNNITKLKIGAVLVLPELSKINGTTSNITSTKTDDVKTQKSAEINSNKTTTANIKSNPKADVIDIPTKLSIESVIADKETNTKKITDTKASTEKVTSTISALDTTDLEKRIRELRSELDQAKSGLEKMESELTTKDAIIFEKDNQLVDLKSSLIKLKIDRTKDVSLENKETVPKDILVEKEMTVEKPRKTAAQIATLKILKQSSEVVSEKGFNQMLSNSVKEYYNDASPKNLAYLTMALILGWILIRYRREIYSYTAINFDQPKYYPAPGIDEYVLKERNIAHQEPIREKNAAEEYFENIQNEPESVLNDEPIKEIEDEAKLEPIVQKSESKVNESEDIKHCEHLVTELFNDLNSSASSKTEVSIGDNEWLSIEKICDEYIENQNENILESVAEDNIAEIDIITADDNHVVDFKDIRSSSDVADFDAMMSDLLKSLDGVEKSINDNSSLKRNVQDIKTQPPEKTS